MMLSSELKSRPLSGIASMRLLSTRLFNLSENSITGDVALDRDRFGLRADLELEIDLGHRVGVERRLAADRLEALQLGGDLVDADRQLRDAEASRRVGRRDACQVRIGTHGGHGCTG